MEDSSASPRSRLLPASGIVLIAAGVALAGAAPKAGLSLLAESSSLRYLISGAGIAAAAFGLSLIAASFASRRPIRAGIVLAGLAASALIVSVFHSYVGLYRRSFESRTLSNLAALRRDPARFDADRRGTAPLPPAAAPMAYLPDLHKDSAAVLKGPAADDSGGWLLDPSSAGGPAFGLRVNCTHTDSRGTAWSSY